MNLLVFVEFDGTFEQLGNIVTKSGVGGTFCYCDSWVKNHLNHSLSISLPVSSHEFRECEMKPYFSGLLPEEQALAEVASTMHITSRSFLKILKSLGDECIGAVRIVDGEAEESSKTPRYETLCDEDLKKIATSSYSTSAVMNVEARLSIAGAQAKTGVYIDPVTGEFCLPKNSAPSNWIAKPNNRRFDSLIDNEFYCMRLARSCGLKVAECKIYYAGEPLLLIKRFDRVQGSSDAIIDGHSKFFRLHQEDFCQALGILNSKKYETQHAHFARKSADLLRQHCTDSISALKEFFNLVAFNFLIGNCDAHLKNYSLIRSQDWKTLSLAPAYDLVSTATYENLSSTLAMFIGKAQKLENVTKESFCELGFNLGFSSKATQKLLEEFLANFSDGIKSCGCESKTAETVKQESLQRLSQIM